MNDYKVGQYLKNIHTGLLSKVVVVDKDQYTINDLTTGNDIFYLKSWIANYFRIATEKEIKKWKSQLL